MAGPIEILIVVGVFGLIGTYLYIASRFLRESELATPECQECQVPAADAASDHHHKFPAHAH